MSNHTIKYLTDIRKNRNSGAKVSDSMKDKVETIDRVQRSLHKRKSR